MCGGVCSVYVRFVLSCVSVVREYKRERERTKRSKGERRRDGGREIDGRLMTHRQNEFLGLVLRYVTRNNATSRD